MKDKGYYHRLILPQNDLNKGTPYANRVVGNHPHMMPLDEHLNQDLHNKVDVHTVLTKHLPDDDPLKFSKRTPDRMQRAYLKLWDPSLGPDEGAPTSKRIQEDINRVINETYLDIFYNRGMALAGNHRCKGRRKHECGLKGKRGGARIKKPKMKTFRGFIVMFAT